MTAAVYVDGLNFYYGLANPLNCKWVDLQLYFEKHFPGDDIRRIYFFEALIAGPHRANQVAYISALETLPKVQVVLGEMKEKNRQCRVQGCGHTGARYWTDHEEKHTDVSIAISMVDDTHRASYEKLILVTADTDLVPAVRMAKIIRPQQQILLCMPALHRTRIWGCKPIAQAADRATRADAELLLKCQFPPTFADANGFNHTKPGSWRIAPLDAARNWKAKNNADWLPKLPKWCR